MSHDKDSESGTGAWADPTPDRKQAEELAGPHADYCDLGIPGVPIKARQCDCPHSGRVTAIEAALREAREESPTAEECRRYAAEAEAKGRREGLKREYALVKALRDLVSIAEDERKRDAR